MPFSYAEEWLVEKRVRLATFHGTVSRDDMHAADARALAALEGGDHKVHLILDLRQLLSYPALNDALKMKHIFHPNLGWYVTIGAARSAVSRAFLSMLMALARVKYKDTRSLDEAYRFLYTADSTLPETISHV